MMTSGLIVMLDPDSPAGDSALAALRAADPFTVGDQRGRLLSAVLETRDAVESERWHDWLRQVPGVEDVEVVFVHWEDADAEVPHADA